MRSAINLFLLWDQVYQLTLDPCADADADMRLCPVLELRQYIQQSGEVFSPFFPPCGSYPFDKVSLWGSYC